MVQPFKKVEKEGIIMKIKTEEYKNSEPTPLPDGFEWDVLDMTKEESVKELSEFINEHYVESATGDFRVVLTPDYLQWAYLTPGYSQRHHTIIRNNKSKKILANIMSVNVKPKLFGKEVNDAF